MSETAHNLRLSRDHEGSRLHGRELWVGTCTCQTMAPTPSWPDTAVQSAYQAHIVQAEAAQLINAR